MPVDRAQLLNSARTNVADLSRGNLGVPLLLLVMLAMMMLPIPPFLLDVFCTFNIALSIVVLLVCVYALRPLDFAVFPTILLVATLLRLALNVASTRGGMLHGQENRSVPFLQSLFCIFCSPFSALQTGLGSWGLSVKSDGITVIDL